MLVIVAEQKGFFKKEGVDAEFRPLQNGKVSFDAVAAGQVDLAVVTDANIGVLGFAGLGDVVVLGSIMQKSDDALVARRDHAISSPADLLGKRVAYVPAGTSEVFLQRFSAQNHLDLSRVIAEPMTAQAMQAAITHGDVDAVSIWQPFRLNIMNLLGNKGIQFANSGTYWSETFLTAKRSTLFSRSEEIQRVVRALFDASIYIRSHRAESIDLLAKAIGVDPAALTASWDEYKFDVGDDPKLKEHLAQISESFALMEPSLTKRPRPNFSDVSVQGVFRDVKQEFGGK